MKMRFNLRHLLICNHMRFDFCFPPALLGWVHDKNVSSRCEFGVASVPEGSEAISCIEAARRHDSADTFFRPKLPDCLQRWPMTLQHPASATPELKRFNTAAYAVHREPPQNLKKPTWPLEFALTFTQQQMPAQANRLVLPLPLQLREKNNRFHD